MKSRALRLTWLIPGLLMTGLSAAGADTPVASEVEQGQEIYARCAACHSLERDRVGPRHCGLIGRRAGSVPGFEYSDAMRDSGLVWDRATLDRFLADPLGTVPGTFMGYAGLSDPAERAQLIAYLEAANRGAGCRSPVASISQAAVVQRSAGNEGQDGHEGKEGNAGNAAQDGD